MDVAAVAADARVEVLVSEMEREAEAVAVERQRARQVRHAQNRRDVGQLPLCSAHRGSFLPANRGPTVSLTRDRRCRYAVACAEFLRFRRERSARPRRRPWPRRWSRGAGTRHRRGHRAADRRRRGGPSASLLWPGLRTRHASMGYPFSSFFSSSTKRQSVPWAMIFFGSLLITPTSWSRSA